MSVLLAKDIGFKNLSAKSHSFRHCHFVSQSEFTAQTRLPYLHVEEDGEQTNKF